MKIIKIALSVLCVALIGWVTSFLGTQNVALADSMEGFPGTWSGKENTLDLSPSVAGDLLFGYNNGCVYGAFSHVALVATSSTYTNGQWDGATVESTQTSDPNKSVRTTTKQSRWHKYDRASLDYFSKSGYSKPVSSIISTAKGYQGPYSVTASFTSNTKWYCAKLVSRAYYDNNNYNLGFLVWGSLIAPQDIYYDSAIHQRTQAYSSGYVTAMVASANVAKTSTNPDVNVKNVDTTFNYKGYKVHSKKLSTELKQVVDERIKEEATAGKANLVNKDLEISKPGLNEYLKDLLDKGEVTKQQVKDKWNLTDSEIDSLSNNG